VGTIETQKPHCLLCGGVVPGWFLDGSANTFEPRMYKKNIACCAAAWFLDGSANTFEPRMYKKHIACCAAAWFLDGSWMVPGWLRKHT
jgi:hypothetical protein